MFKELYSSAVRAANEEKKNFEKLLVSGCFDAHLSEEESKNPVILAMLRRAVAMGGGMDIMKKVVEKQRTTKKKKTKKDYFTNGWGIVKKWQEKKQNKPPKETNPQTGDKFNVMKMVVKHPTPVKKQSLMEPLEKNPPKKRIRKKFIKTFF